MDARAEGILRLATAEICRRLLQRGRQAPPALLPFYEELCRQLRDGAVVTRRLRAALGPGPWPDARSLRRFAEACQLEVVSLALHLAEGSVATGRMACAAGIESYNTYVRIHRASTGESPTFLHVPARPVFDALRWHQIAHDALRPADAEGLARRATHRLAAYVYRVREIQCFVTADRLLEAGQIPSVEPWAECLRVMSREDPVPLEEWRNVVERLTDAKRAVELWIAADTERRRLLEKTGEDRIQALRKRASYLLARTCLFAAERYHRGQGLHGLMLEENQAAVAMARWLRKRHFSRRSRSRPRRPSVLTDLEVLALARIANDRRIGGNADLAVAAIGEAQKAARKAPIGDYVRAEVASLEASVLKDQGLDLARAEERADEAIRIFGTFDVHMAALVRLKKAEIWRFGFKHLSLTEVREAMQQLDGSREPRAVEIAHNNLLLYLVEQKRREAAQHWRRVLPAPSWPVEQANRINLEGYIEFLWGDIDRAESFLKEAVRLFVQLDMHADAMTALLYLAALQDLKGLSDQVRKRLTEAAQLATAGGYVIGVSIRELIHQMDEVQDLYERILAIATEAGGCLGSGEPRHRVPN